MTISSLMGHFVQILSDYFNCDVLIEFRYGNELEEEKSHYPIDDVVGPKPEEGKRHVKLVVNP